MSSIPHPPKERSGGRFDFTGGGIGEFRSAEAERDASGRGPARSRRVTPLRRSASAWVLVAFLGGGLAHAAPPGNRPDLVVDLATLVASLSVQPAYITPQDTCPITAGCVPTSGFRTFLQFDTVVANISQTSLDLGSPNSSPYYYYDTCYGTYRFDDFVLYELLDTGSSVVASMYRDIGYPDCVQDSFQYLSDSWVAPSPAYSCGTEGVQGGWAVQLEKSGYCQWLDVTDLQPGDYTLRVTVNPHGDLQEVSTTNNSAEVAVTIPPAPPPPDLIFDLATPNPGPDTVSRYFAPGHAAVTEGCVADSGYRDLLRFSTLTANISQTDFVVGEPGLDPRWEFEPLHGHYHFQNFSLYELLDLQNNVVTAAPKMGWYLASTTQYIFEPWVPQTPYWTFLYGISRGWGDLYSRTIPCQWMDVTDVPVGGYKIRATVNPIGVFEESDYSNNVTYLSVFRSTVRGMTHRPDGVHFPMGNPLVVDHDPAGLRLTYDVSFCPANSYNLYYGINRPVSDYVYDGAICDLGNTGTAIVSIPDPAPGQMAWMIVAGIGVPDALGRVMEGGHGLDSDLKPRPSSGIGFCNVINSEATAQCATLPDP